MDRPIIYASQIPFETDLLSTNQNIMASLGMLIQAVLGTATTVDGLACTPTTPASLGVLVGPGSIYSQENLESTAYSSLPADTAHQIVKQGIALDNTSLICPAPVTTGQSVVYLVQAKYQDEDTGAEILEYYNPDDPEHPYSGPDNSGASQYTIRKGSCIVSVKAGIPATTGTQVAPAPDAGYTGLYAVTVANGQTTITSPNIQQLASAPFIGTKLPNLLSAIQQDAPNYAQDTSGAANTITVTLSPAPAALTDGMPIRVKVANASTGATVMNVNGLGNVACKTPSGGNFGANTVVANGVYTFVYDANGNRFQLQTASVDLSGYAPLNSAALTGTPTAPTAANGTNTTQLATCAFAFGQMLTGGFKLPNGKIIQICQFTTSASGYSTLTFPSAFPNSVDGVFGALDSTTPLSGGGWVVFNYGAKTLSTIPVATIGIAGGSAVYTASSVYCFVIGS